MDVLYPYWRTTLVGNATPNRIPLLLDAWWLGGAPTENDVPPRKEEVFANTQGGVNQIQRYCVNRHSAAVNGVFLDFSVRRIGLKELWALKWHKEFNTRGHWTSNDPDSSARWKMAAPWMAQMREY